MAFGAALVIEFSVGFSAILASTGWLDQSAVYTVMPKDGLYGDVAGIY